MKGSFENEKLREVERAEQGFAPRRNMFSLLFSLNEIESIESRAALLDKDLSSLGSIPPLHVRGHVRGEYLEEVGAIAVDKGVKKRYTSFANFFAKFENFQGVVHLCCITGCVNQRIDRISRRDSLCRRHMFCIMESLILAQDER